MMDTETIQVLLVEDSSTDALIVQEELAQTANSRFAVAHVEQLKEALERLAAQRFDVVLLDLSLPDSQGFETFVRLHNAAPDLPVVVLSGRADGLLGIQAVQAGAQDYLVKGCLNEDVLPRSIRYAIERQRSERTLAESEERYRLLIENSPDAYLVHCDGKIVFANTTSLRLLGAERLDELLGRAMLDHVAPESQGLVGQRIDEVHVNGSNPPLEVVCIRLDGTTVTVEGTSNPFMHAGRPAVQAVLRDITERKRAEERVREQASMLDHAHDAIIVRDINTRRITFWNRGAERLYGWTAAEAVGRHIGELIFAEKHASNAVTGELLRTGEWRGEGHHVTRAGTALLVSSHITLVCDAHGVPKSALVINIDITEQKQMEQQFLRAQRMESIGTLAGGIAHDLNNVLAPIMMSIDLLKMSCREERTEKILATMESSTRRGADMVQQILSFARGVEGQRAMIDLLEIILGMRHLVQDTFPKNILFRADLPARLPTFMGDHTQVHQVLLNLCVNARDAMAEGGTLTVSADSLVVDESYAAMHPDAMPGTYVRVQVTDTGTGIPQEVVDKIFDPFFTTKELGKGTGLGLSTVLAIIKSHGGFLCVKSKPRHGTTFSVSFPASISPDCLPPVVTVETPPRGQGELILVVDDEDAVRAITQQTLEAYGYQVLVAADGVEAISLFARHLTSVAAVLTDMMMPVMDGPATIRALQSMKPTVKIIAASGLDSAADSVSAIGVKHFLPKPYTAQTILKALNEVLNRKC